MIQFNLLPDIKLQYIHARRSKRLIVVSSIGAGGAALLILILLFVTVNVFQHKHLDDLNKDVAKLSKQLKDTPNLSKILTIQNQLNSLPQLHDKKPVVTRLPGYLGQITPTQISISKLDIKFSDTSISLTGASDSINSINKFIDTLKFTTYNIDGTPDSKKAFSDVVLSSFGRDDKGASYSILFKYDPAIFDIKDTVKLTVPTQITTRSVTEKPTDLFQPNSNTKSQ